MNGYFIHALPTAPHVLAVVPWLVEAAQWLVLLYGLGIALVYLSLNVVAHLAIRRQSEAWALDELPRYALGLDPGITLLVPAYNEEAVIAMSVRSMLQIDYPDYEVIVVNDGSKDQTLATMVREFNMVLYPQSVDMAIPVQPIRGVYRSLTFPQLKVIDKVNGGKADAMNAAINAASHALVCAVDADSVLERDSLSKLARPFLEDRSVIAAGGTIRIANGCEISQGHLQSVRMPTGWLARFQVIEYLRAFLFGRLGWSPMNAMLIISGAFGLFRRQTMIEVGGFSANTIGEDMELVVRMHRLKRKARTPYRIVYVPDSVCWTEAPEDLGVLKSQRVRWQRGLLESLWQNRGMLFARGSGAPGWLAFPVFVFFEAAGPLIEAVGFATLVLAFVLGSLSWQALVVMSLLVMAVGMLLSASALLLEERHFGLYTRKRDLLTLLVTVVIENLGYRQINAWWRVLGAWRWLCGRPQVWGTMTRKGLGT